MAIVDNLPVDMILGRDLPVLTELLQAAKDCATITANVDVSYCNTDLG